MCVKLVIYKDRTRMHGQRNIKFLYIYFVNGVNLLRHSVLSLNCVTQVRYFVADLSLSLSL